MHQELVARNDADFLEQGTAMLEHTIDTAVRERGFAILGLSGGSTPKPIYEALGTAKMDWSMVWIFLVDDRYVRADDPNSNQFLLRSTLLKHAPVPASQIIFPDTTLPLSECVNLYNQHLNDLLQKGSPDIITLGMGDDGHIASLFPPLSDEAFGPSCAIHTTTATFAVKDRISVTMPVLRKARQAVFFLKGAEKKQVWEEMMESAEGGKMWPAKTLPTATVIAQW